MVEKIDQMDKDIRLKMAKYDTDGMTNGEAMELAHDIKR